MPDNFAKIFRDYSEMSVRYDGEQEAIWCYFNPRNRPCFSTVLLKEIKEIQESIIRYFQANEKREKYPVRYLIIASQTPGVFNFGGDLSLFIQLITDQKREQLLEYATNCIDILYMNAVSLHLPLTLISFVEGTALGGGFEAALSTNVLIAEKHAQMGVPEIRFNLFPGMGAYSFLARKAGVNVAERLLCRGKIYNASELHEMCVVDVLAESEKGREAVNSYINTHKHLSNGMQAIQAVKQFYNPITYEELISITKIWVDAALRLSKKNLHLMERLVASQNRMTFNLKLANNIRHVIRTKQDRRCEHYKVTFPLMDNAGKQIHVDRRGLDRRQAVALKAYN
jgi:DSF synthase